LMRVVFDEGRGAEGSFGGDEAGKRLEGTGGGGAVAVVEPGGGVVEVGLFDVRPGAAAARGGRG
jgi:hypothetical protein